ncbi:hypothetical protein OIU77_012397 [Salix suchowensis]|uniref:Uncharacterized protein n=1 Tax=Salix suchowensis TaxID=1278906 RepID=A0ABQ9A3P9_9ROSI|nr:hypothetical protein OIU77_012397 [Salix suchowensis]
MEGVLVRNLCSSSSATVPLVPPPRPSFLFQRKASFPPSNSTMFPLLSSLFSAPSRSFSSVIYATPDSQLSVGTDTDTREWAMQGTWRCYRIVSWGYSCRFRIQQGGSLSKYKATFGAFNYSRDIKIATC